MKKILFNFFRIGIIVVAAVFLLGCFDPFDSGEYERNGNRATFWSSRGEGNATVSGNTLTGIFEGVRFTLTRANTSANSFAGTWTGRFEGEEVELAMGHTLWFLGVDSYIEEYGTYTQTGTHVDLMDSDGYSLDWVFSGNTLIVEGDRIRMNRTATNSNPFAGTWTGIVTSSGMSFSVELVFSNAGWVAHVQ
jgi:hypothetical protein